MSARFGLVWMRQNPKEWFGDADSFGVDYVGSTGSSIVTIKVFFVVVGVLHLWQWG